MTPLLRRVLFNSPAPRVKLLHFASSASDLTTYTFTNVPLGERGTNGFTSNEVYGDSIMLRTPARKAIVIVVHAEDAAATFSVSSVTAGTVAGIEAVDRGGATSAINTAIYVFTEAEISQFTNESVVVTMSEAVTSCAIGVLLVENFSVLLLLTSATAVGTGALALAPVASVDDRFQLCIIGATCVGLETFAIETFAGQHADILYDNQSAEASYACAWGYSKQFVAAGDTNLSYSCSFSSTGAGDAVALVMG